MRYPDVSTDFDSSVGKYVSRNLSLQFSSHLVLEGQGGHNAQIGSIVNFSNNNRIDLTTDWNEHAGTKLSLDYTYHGGTDSSFDVSMNLTSKINSDDSTQLSAKFDWRITPNLALNLFAGSDTYGVSISWSDLMTQTPGPLSWNDFAKGTISGRVTYPLQDHDEAVQPIAGATVRVDNALAETDEEGRYEVTGLPTYTKLLVSVDANSLDATLAPVNNFTLAYLRPASHLKYNPTLTWTKGVDGYIVYSQPIPPGGVIEIYQSKSNTLIKRVTPDTDGFFIVEGLTSDQYTFTLSGVESPPDPINVKLTEDIDWLSDLKWEWP